MRYVAIVGLALLLIGCSSQYERSLSRLAWFMGWNQVGSSPDYWLNKGSFGVQDRVAVIFGYLSDEGGCMEIAELLNREYPSTGYYCTPAN